MKSLRLYIYTQISRCLPETRCFSLKARLLRWCGADVGAGVRICSSARFIGAGHLSIGDNTWVGPQCLISASLSVRIGRNCDIAPRVYIGDGTHVITPDQERIGANEVSKGIAIGDGCWLCVNSTILPGVSVGDKCVVAAGAVVTADVEPLSLVAGTPAKVKKRLA